MAKLTVDEHIDAFKEMTLLELSELIKKFEETFEVTAAAPVAMMSGGTAPGGGDGGGEEAEEKTAFDVILTSAGEKKIQVIKEVRALTSLGLKEAKELVEAAPKPVLEGIAKEAAEEAKAKIEAAGGSADIK